MLEIPVESLAVVPIHLDKLLVAAGFVASRAAAQRLIKQGAVSIRLGDEEPWERCYKGLCFINQYEPTVVKVGKTMKRVRIEK